MYCNIVKARDKDLKNAFRNAIEILKEGMNRSLKEIYENTSMQWKETNKIAQDMKVEVESIKKTQPEGNLEMKI